ncbi:glutaredoxin 3 [Ceraceosorus bombacis]|uniref:Glutaredoxin 3 n=1 Tax=Ceraceosorus bombacis TaxID=401625 RepID=A0A0N7L9E7_9BASI|nr:glutaredoxin 3 [Ceraceosorus bombacis]
MSAQKVVEDLIKSTTVAVFSKSYCPYCSRVKSALPSLGAQFKVLELDQESSGSEYQSYLAEKTGQRTVPNVFVNGKHVGGCDDFFKAQSSGELSKLIGA